MSRVYNSKSCLVWGIETENCKGNNKKARMKFRYFLKSVKFASQNRMMYSWFATNLYNEFKNIYPFYILISNLETFKTKYLLVLRFVYTMHIMQ